MKRGAAIAWLAFLASAVVCRAELHPIVDVETGILLGAANGQKWLTADSAKGAIKGGERYRVYDLSGGIATATGGKPKSAGEPCVDVTEVTLNPTQKSGALAVGGNGNAMPRVPHTEDPTQNVYVETVRDFLVARGLKSPEVKITQILRIDLDGDGEDEVLISGTNFFTKDSAVPNEASEGSYSFVLVRRVVAEKVETKMLAGNFFPGEKSKELPMSYRVLAVLDLTGEGVMEVVVRGAYYEGMSDTVFRCTAKKIETLLEVGCGA